MSKRTEPQRELSCTLCGVIFQHVGRRPAKTCPSCRKAAAAERSRQYRIRKGLIRNPGVGSGGAQYGKHNSQWRGGVAAYRRVGREGKHSCELCGASYDNPSMMLVHHNDGDRSNNVLTNLSFVCKKCHQVVLHPLERDSKGRFIAEEKPRNEAGNPGDRQPEPKARL